MLRQDYKGRIRSLKEGLAKRKLDAILVTNEANVSYLSAFKGHDSFLLVAKNRSYFITDSRYAEDAEDDVKGFDIKIVRESTYSTIKYLVRRMRFKRVGFESMNLAYAIAHKLGSLITPCKLVYTKGFVEGLRSIKDSAEVEFIRKSARLAKKILGKVIEEVRPGVSEDFVGRKAEIEFIKYGARAAFEPIVASGANSSKPHARTSVKKIKNNSFVKLDIGGVLDGYNSDITRMAILGNPGARFKKVYDIVREAQDRAISSIRPGVKIAEVDKAARGYIEKRGFGSCFTHALGHGVGREVHEEPSVSSMSEGVIKPGMIFTVEPAIYIQGFGGVRIEDMALVTDKGCEILTR